MTQTTKEQLAEQILNKHFINGEIGEAFVYITDKKKLVAAIVEAMDAPAKEGMKVPKWLQHLNKEVKFGHEGSKQEGIIKGYHPEYGVVIFLPRKVFSSYRYVSEHLIEWPESKGVEAISVPAQRPSLEEKKEDLVVSDNNSSTVPCVTPLYDNNSIQQ